MENKKHVKVVETSDVSAENLEEILNEAMEGGWVLDRMHFAMREASRRPAMAFLVFFNQEIARELGMYEKR